MYSTKEYRRMSLDMPLELYNQVQEAALNNQRTKSQEIRMRLIKSFEYEQKAQQIQLVENN